MAFLHYYILGVLVCFLCSLLLEHLYFGNGRAETVKLDMIGADFLYSLLSWIGLAGVVVMFIGEWYCGFDQKGVGEKLYEYEEKLKEEKKRKKTSEQDWKECICIISCNRSQHKSIASGQKEEKKSKAK